MLLCSDPNLSEACERRSGPTSARGGGGPWARRAWTKSYPEVWAGAVATAPDRRQVWVEGIPQTLPQGGQGMPWPG